MKRFFNKIVLFLHTLFTNVDTWIHDHIQPSIEVVQWIKAMVDSPIADLVVTLIPGNADDVIRGLISSFLGKAIDDLKISEDILNTQDTRAKLIKLINFLKSLSPALQNAVYFKLASQLAKVKAGTDNFKGHAVDLLTQMQYSKMKEGVQADDLPVETLVNGNLIPDVAPVNAIPETPQPPVQVLPIQDAIMPTVAPSYAGQ